MTTLARLRVNIDVDNDGVTRGIARARSSFTKFRNTLDSDGNKTGVRWAKSLNSGMNKALLPMLAVTGAAASAQLIGSMGSALISGTAKLAHGLGASMALLPAVVGAAGLAFGALKLSLHGVGDALKAGLAGDTEAYTEAMKKLAPAAQAVVREIGGAHGAFERMRKTVQGNFFGPLVGQVSSLARILLPLMTDVLGRVAGAFGRAIAASLDFIKTPAVFSRIAGAIRNAGTAVENMTAGIPNLVRAFIPLFTVGASFLPGLTGGFENATARLARFMEEAERTGKLREWIQEGIDSLKSLWETTKQVGRIFENFGDAMSLAFSGVAAPSGDLLDKLERLSERAKAFFGNARNRNAVSDALRTAREHAQEFLDRLKRVGEILAPILPQLGEFFAAFFEFKVAALEALAPVVRFIGEKLLPVLTSILTWVAKTEPVMYAFLAGMAAKWIYSGTQAAIAAGKTVAAFVTMMAQAATATAKIVAQIALQIAQWVVLGVQSMIHAAKVAAAWLISMGPIGLIIAAVVGLVAVIIANWDTIWRVITGVASAILDFLKKHWPIILAILTGPIGAIVIAIVKNWDTIWRVTTSVFGAIADFFGRVVGAIGRTLGAIPGVVWDVIKGIATFIGRLPGMIWNGIKGIGSMLWNLFKGGFDGVVNLVKWWIGTVLWMLGELPSKAWTALKGLGDVIWNVVKSAVNGAIGLINYIIELWNDFSIGMSWGGFDPPGPGRIPGFSFELRTPNISKIPKLADGGIAMGATLGIFGEAGPEAIIPLDRLGDIMGDMPAGQGGGGTTVTFDFQNADSELGRALKKMIRVKGRGSAEVFFS